MNLADCRKPILIHFQERLCENGLTRISKAYAQDLSCICHDKLCVCEPLSATGDVQVLCCSTLLGILLALKVSDNVIESFG